MGTSTLPFFKRFGSFRKARRLCSEDPEPISRTRFLQLLRWRVSKRSGLSARVPCTSVKAVGPETVGTDVLVVTLLWQPCGG